MKKIMIIALLALTASCASIKIGSVDPVQASVENTETKLNNYIAANEWMVESFVSAKSVIQFTDKEVGIVKGKYLLHYSPGVYVGYGVRTPDREGYAIITIRTKDNSADIKITAESVPYVNNTGFTVPSLIEYNQKLQKLANDFINYIK